MAALKELEELPERLLATTARITWQISEASLGFGRFRFSSVTAIGTIACDASSGFWHQMKRPGANSCDPYLQFPLSLGPSC